MKTIKTLADLRNLRRSGAVPPGLFRLIEEDFHEALQEAACPDEDPGEDFSLEGHGHLVLLEPGDSPADWAKEGLSPDPGHAGPSPQFFQAIILDDRNVYCFSIKFTDGNIVQFYSPAGIHRPDLEAYLWA